MIVELLWACIKAFLVGGSICAIGQVLLDYTKMTPARILFSFVVAGVILGAFGIYQPLVDFAGSGASVPLTGFGNLLAQGVKEAVDQDGFIGIFTGGICSAAGGLTAAIFFGLLIATILKPNDKNK